MKPCWQIYATGESLNGWHFKMRSKKIFLDQEAAKAYIPEFHKLCTDRNYIECAEDNDKLTFELYSLELVE